MALNFPKEQRDYLVRWSAQGLVRYSRVASRVIVNLQRAVGEALRDTAKDPLGEQETAIQYEEYMVAQKIDEAERTRCLNLLIGDLSAPLA